METEMIAALDCRRSVFTALLTGVTLPLPLYLNPIYLTLSLLRKARYKRPSYEFMKRLAPVKRKKFANDIIYYVNRTKVHEK